MEEPEKLSYKNTLLKGEQVRYWAKGPSINHAKKQRKWLCGWDDFEELNSNRQ